MNELIDKYISTKTHLLELGEANVTGQDIDNLDAVTQQLLNANVKVSDIESKIPVTMNKDIAEKLRDIILYGNTAIPETPKDIKIPDKDKEVIHEASPEIVDITNKTPKNKEVIREAPPKIVDITNKTPKDIQMPVINDTAIPKIPTKKGINDTAVTQKDTIKKAKDIEIHTKKETEVIDLGNTTKKDVLNAAKYSKRPYSKTIADIEQVFDKINIKKYDSPYRIELFLVLCAFLIMIVVFDIDWLSYVLWIFCSACTAIIIRSRGSCELWMRILYIVLGPMYISFYIAGIDTFYSFK
jgi:hypothetical protein